MGQGPDAGLLIIGMVKMGQILQLLLRQNSCEKSA